jgi:protein-disulfide isomerase
MARGRGAGLVVGVVLAVIVFGLGGIACFGAAMVGILAYQTDQVHSVNRPSGHTAASVGARSYVVSQAAPTLDGTEPTVGSSDAAVRVVTFSDFGCPHCATAFANLRALAGEGRIQLVHKAFPLSGACNSLMMTSTQSERCDMAVAAECAHLQGSFEEYASDLYENAAMVDGHESLIHMARETGLDLPQFQACLIDTATLDDVRVDVAHGIALDVAGTPTVLLHGSQGNDWLVVNAADVSGLAR